MSSTTASVPSPRSAGRSEGPREVGGVRRVAVPPAARRLCTLSRVDYEDSFEVQTGPVNDRTAEQWARAIFEDAPLATRIALRSAWFLIGAELHRDPPEQFVFGLKVLRSTSEFVFLGVSSRLGARAELLLEREPHALRFTSFVQLDTRPARMMWARAAAGHRFAVRYLFGHGARRIYEKDRAR